MPNPLTPQPAVITDVRRDTPDVATFRVELPAGGAAFAHLPGQCAMLGLPGAGEAMFSITSAPTRPAYHEFSIKRCGSLTDLLHRCEPGQQLTLRGP